MEKPKQNLELEVSIKIEILLQSYLKINFKKTTFAVQTSTTQ